MKKMLDATTVVCLKQKHNHECGTSATLLKYRDVNETIIEKLTELFNHGHSPASARNIIQSDALCLHDDQYYK